MEKVHIIIGLSKSGLRVIKELSEISNLLVIERDEDKLKELKEATEGSKKISFAQGDGTSIYFWKHEIDIENVNSVILFVDYTLTVEIANLLRNIVNFTGPIICVWRGGEIPSEFEKYQISVIDVPKLIYLSLLNQIKGSNLVKFAYGVGLEEGEVVEVTITETSPALNKPLKHLGMRNVRIVLIYRGEEVILPKGDTVIEQGDRLLIVGEPSYVKIFVEIILKGLPDFPLRWGNKLIYCSETNFSHYDEIDYMKSVMMIHSVVKKASKECEIGNQPEDTGILVFDYIKRGFWSPSVVDTIFKRATVPVLLSKRTHPYENILISLNTDGRDMLMSSGIDIIRQANAKGSIIYVATVENMRTEEEKEYIKSLRSMVSRYTKTYNMDIELKIKEGNPVRETLKELKGYDLLVLGFRTGKTSTFFEPYTPHLLAEKSNISTLLIPS